MANFTILALILANQKRDWNYFSQTSLYLFPLKNRLKIVNDLRTFHAFEFLVRNLVQLN